LGFDRAIVLIWELVWQSIGLKVGSYGLKFSLREQTNWFFKQKACR